MKLLPSTTMFLNALIKELNDMISSQSEYNDKNAAEIVIELSKLSGITSAIAKEADLITKDIDGISAHIIKDELNKTYKDSTAREKASEILASLITPKKVGVS